jgi:hypothetical protein
MEKAQEPENDSLFVGTDELTKRRSEREMRGEELDEGVAAALAKLRENGG